ncbi:Transcription-repair-coupling factor [Bacillus safensis subsp. safensis]
MPIKWGSPAVPAKRTSRAFEPCRFYAYFTYRKDKVLSEVAEKRLQAIKEFTELGSGFKIAMRDLTIRGAGNLLGAQQHGFIDSVGFDLYSQMLKEAIEERRGDISTAQA